MRTFLEKSFRDKESEHHREADGGLTKIAMSVEQNPNDPIPVYTKELVQGIDYDLITATYPDTITEIYTYTLSAVTILVVTVVYASASKKDILTASFV